MKVKKVKEKRTELNESIDTLIFNESNEQVAYFDKSLNAFVVSDKDAEWWED